MTRHELHNELKKVLYIEDTNLVDTMLASVIANSQKIGDPVWLTIIGPSSGGKSQYIRPLAKANPELFLQIDDLTANTFISGNGENQSLIFKIKKGASGIISMDDLTVLFSKNSEDRNAILAQFRMIYDGRMTKASGKSGGQGITWEGHAGMIAGSTPAIYRHFSEVADMGERFINYRMKAMDEDKAVEFVMSNNFAARDMDEKLKLAYGKYFSEIMPKVDPTKIEVDDETMQAILNISKAGTRLRTPVITDDREHFVSEFPVSEMPFRVMKQLTNVAKAFTVMHHAETGETVLPSDLRTAIEWIGYSLADDKRRAYFNAVLALEESYITGTTKTFKATARNIAAYTGLHHTAVERGMSVLSAIGVVKLNEAEHENQAKSWSIADTNLRDIVKRIDPPKKVEQDDYETDEEDK
jgi:hypothetical protein